MVKTPVQAGNVGSNPAASTKHLMRFKVLHEANHMASFEKINDAIEKANHLVDFVGLSHIAIVYVKSHETLIAFKCTTQLPWIEVAPKRNVIVRERYVHDVDDTTLEKILQKIQKRRKDWI